MARPKKTTPVAPPDLKAYKEAKQQLSIYQKVKQFLNQFNIF